MSTLYHFCVQIANISMRKACFKPYSQKNVPANNCHLKVIHTSMYMYNILSCSSSVFCCLSVCRIPLTGSIPLPLAEDNPLISANTDYKQLLERSSKSAIYCSSYAMLFSLSDLFHFYRRGSLKASLGCTIL